MESKSYEQIYGNILRNGETVVSILKNSLDVIDYLTKTGVIDSREATYLKIEALKRAKTVLEIH